MFFGFDAVFGAGVADAALGEDFVEERITLLVAVEEGGEFLAGVVAVGIVDFDDPSVLRKRGHNLYEAPAGTEPRPAVTRVKQKALESSGVNALEQLREMIKTQRLFQANVTMMQIQDQTLELAVSRVGSIQG